MKVTGIETILLDNVPPYRGGRQFLFIRLLTDEGIVGLGERPTGHTPDLKSQVALLHDFAERFVVGASPFDIEAIWQRAYASNHDYRHPSLYGTPALSAIEMALWDIIGKATGQPIYNLLGGRCHDKLRAYAYMPTDGVWENPARAGDIAAKLVEEGNTACKIDPFMPYFPLPRDFPLENDQPRREDLSRHPRCGGRRVGDRHRHARPVQHGRRHSRCQGVRGISAVLVRGAGAAGECGRDGPRRRAHQHPHRFRRTAGDALRVL